MYFTTYFIDYFRAVDAKMSSQKIIFFVDQCAAPHQILSHHVKKNVCVRACYTYEREEMRTVFVRKHDHFGALSIDGILKRICEKEVGAHVLD
jgi:hypothetical protein